MRARSIAVLAEGHDAGAVRKPRVPDWHLRQSPRQGLDGTPPSVGIWIGAVAVFGFLSAAAHGAGVAIVEVEGDVVCHAAVIGPRSVLTMHHCMAYSDLAAFRILIMETGERLSVVAVEAAPTYEAASTSGDSPLLLKLNRAHDAGHLVSSRGQPRAILRAARPSAAASLVKVEIVARDGPLWYVRPSVCEGDSGAPAVDRLGGLVALVVGVTGPDCAGGLTVLHRILGPVR